MKIILPLLLLCSAAYGAPCPTGQMKDAATLVQIEHVWVRTVEQHDTAALGCILADEFEEADFEGSLIDRPAMLASAANRGSVHYEFVGHACPRVWGFRLCPRVGSKQER